VKKINNYKKNLVDEMMKVSESNPDVIFYMEALMKEYEELEQKVEQLENIRKEAIEYMKENCDIITIDKGWIIRSELTTTGLGKLFKILNKGDNNVKD
jgi:hypothetical protein